MDCNPVLTKMFEQKGNFVVLFLSVQDFIAALLPMMLRQDRGQIVREAFAAIDRTRTTMLWYPHVEARLIA